MFSSGTPRRAALLAHCGTLLHAAAVAVQSTAAALSVWTAGGTAAIADVLHWSEDGQGDDIPPDAFVLRYDALGALIASEDAMKHEGDADVAALESVRTSGQGARMAAVLPALRLTAERYADHAALDLVGLTPKEWSLLFRALVRVESAFNPEAVSSVGARGLAQLMPDTARALGVDIDNPRENLDGGARYLLAQIAAFGALDLALAAYNAGPDAVRKYGGIPPYAETRAYVARVLAEFERLRASSREGMAL